MPGSHRSSELTWSSTSRISYSEHKYAKCFVIPQRYLFCLLASLIMLNAYSIHSALEVIAVEYFDSDKTTNTSDTCPSTPDTRKQIAKRPRNRSLLVYDWSLETRLIIKDSFYWSRLLTIIPGGFVSDQLGGKYVVTLSVLFSAFCHLMAPAVVDLGAGKVGFVVALRVLNGCFQGVLQSAVLSLLARWAPPSERALMASLVYGSASLGEQIAIAMHKAFMNYTWRPMFYLSAGVHVVFCFVWHLLVYPSHRDNPFLTVREKRFLDEEADESLVEGWKKVPWGRILKSGALWSLGFLQVGSSWSYQVYRKILEWYLPRVLKSGVPWESAWWTPFFLYFWLTIFCGFVADWFVKGNHLSVTTVRKTFALIGNYLTALCLMFVTFEGCNSVTVMVYTTVWLCLDATYYASTLVLPLDLTSNFAGITIGIMWTVENLVIGLSRYVVNLLTTDDSLSQWTFLLWVTCGVQITGTTVFLMFGDANRQGWNYIEQ
ncbi:sialin-like [Tribolium castaneum]|uniref:sialin-like n=1 Tax=Tribolium castaneum TaxID=7070 RepID=UPI0000D56DBE|nr:PREDICTED: sialin-like isoform X2 [Tribolium castaneum]|eukprot:XP_974339.1 PREDICTED: sialin-like isoform X2 [Tribolium castaneum]